MGKVFKWIGIVVVGFIVLGVISSMLGGGKTSEKVGTTNTSNSSGTTGTTQLASSYKVGDIIKVSDYIFTVTAFDLNVPSGNEYTKPKDGNQFVKISATIENKGTSKTTVSSLISMYLKDGEGVKYNQTFLVNGKPFDGELLANDKIKGEIYYEVPATVAGLKFYYNPSFLGNQTVVVNLN